jgi:hypothetical protein
MTPQLRGNYEEATLSKKRLRVDFAAAITNQ